MSLCLSVGEKAVSQSMLVAVFFDVRGSTYLVLIFVAAASFVGCGCSIAAASNPFSWDVCGYSSLEDSTYRVGSTIEVMASPMLL